MTSPSAHGGHGPVIPDLVKFTKENLTTIFHAKSQADFDSAFDAFIAREVHITVNGKHVTRDEYKQRLLGERGDLQAEPKLTFEGAVSASADQNLSANAGQVGLFFKAVVFHPYRIHDALASSTIQSSLNLSIASFKGDSVFPSRLVTVWNEVEVETLNAQIY